MRKIIVALMVVAMMLTGCAGFWTKAQTNVCNPPQAVIDVIKAGIPIIKIAINIALPGSQVFTDAIEAEATANLILNTGCVAVTDLNKLIAFIQGTSFAQAQASTAVAKLKAAGTVTQPLNVAPLQAWADSVK